MPSALVFPGQGAQRAGMAADLLAGSPAAMHVFEAAERASGLPIISLLSSGTDDDLRPTEVAQPALLAVEIGLLAAMAESLGVTPGEPWRLLEPLDVSWTAGHSLGEYAACVAAGALTIDDALRLSARRGRLMSEARAGTMAAVLGLEVGAVEALCESAGNVSVANDNAPAQVVVSGTHDAVERVSALALQAGARRVVPLNVAGAFHSPLVAGAAERFAHEIERVPISDPIVPVIGNVAAEPLRAADEIRAELAMQIASPVRWRESMLALAQAGVERLIECGPGDVIAGLVRRTVPAITVSSLGSLAGAQALARSRARAIALQALYEADATHHPPGAAVERIAREAGLGARGREMARSLVAGVIERAVDIDEEITSAAPAWPIAQMARVDKNILRLAIYEAFMDNPALSARAAIADAIELARTYAGDSSVKFVNGVLQTLAERRPRQQPPAPV